jgi:cystathionine beta-lyase/cystathionine gamma-synthase
MSAFALGAGREKTMSSARKSGLPAEARPATVCVHAGWRASSEQPSVVAPIAQTSTFLQDDTTYAAMADGRGDEVLIYSRYSNPTVRVVEERIAALEGGEQCFAFGSGMAALHAGVMACVRTGSTVLVARQHYGGTHDLLFTGLADFGVTVRDYDGLAELESALTPDVDLVVCESVSNPTLIVSDLPRISELAHSVGAKLLVDATFTPPTQLRALDHGADIVMHSGTKYFGGHSDLIAGVLVGSARELAPVLAWRKRAGGILDPHPASLLDRGIKTLALRMDAHTRGATHLARVLSAHPSVRQVFYPGLDSHSTYDLAQRFLSAPGGMLAFEIAGGDEAARALLRAARIAIDAPSFGGVETLLSLPLFMSHASLSEAERRAAGIPAGLVRVSVGIEDPLDLEADFLQALAAASA